ncbi:dipeptide/oligopeptide/nickel ABC transporter permease/ATP-binding protein [Amphibiibacter pelophylacis]|uniref:Dipeptide/oligopeptide/nickel ABC transporter permease/ATP-binding protein n=1 Tax=Amphibiibacter pelophylacis TaxID=1799477 RepID=A0ACC6P1Y2_9BURK
MSLIFGRLFARAPGKRSGGLGLPGRLSLVFIALLVVVAIVGPWLMNGNPNAQAIVADKSPAWGHPFGFDYQGRDIFERLVYGSRWSLSIGLGATAIALALGAFIGAMAATSRRWVDESIMRVLDVIMAFPGIALAAVLVAVFGRGVEVLVVAIGFLYTPMVARLVRANVQAQYEEDYVQAEKIIGAKRFFILVRHVARNCAAPVLVFCTVMVADAIVFEASLSFIGAGVQPPNPSWGSVIADGKNLVQLGGWWATLFPGLLIFSTVVALNILSEGVSDAWAAPSSRRVQAAKAAQAAEQAEAAVDKTAGTLPPLPAGLAQARERLKAQARTFTQEPLLEIQNLKVSFSGSHNGVNIVNGLSLSVRPGEVLGLIGESGCGKSLTSLAIMGLSAREARLDGRILFGGQDLLTLSAAKRRALMGHEIAMIYQDALSSLNPAMTVRAQLQQFISRGGQRSAQELLELVHLDPQRTLNAFPHELSGGQRQRVLIAMALSRNPRLIIADEPTTALDVTVQAQVMQLLRDLQARLGFAMILVSHDLALVSQMADRIAVMYGGELAEEGRSHQVLGSPAHPYTRGLLASVLSLEADEQELSQIRGTVPSPADFPAGCRFAGRCALADAGCHSRKPVAHDSLEAGHRVACHRPIWLSPDDLEQAA